VSVTKKLIVANWKSNKSLSEAQAWLAEAQELNGQFDSQRVKAVLAPPFPFLPIVRENVSQLGWQLAAQDISSFPAGSYTGAVSTHNLQGLEVTYAIVGHSERRQYFQETSQQVAQKAELALSAGIQPIVCVDEQSLAGQASALDSSVIEKCLVTYEPREAIGSGDNASIDEVKSFRQQVKNLFGEVPFLYGGSVDETNIGEYLLVTDGALIGTASLAAKQFIRVLEAAQGGNPADL
jgi:triosephosphate isomerase